MNNTPSPGHISCRPFLEALASAYASLGENLSEYCFVFPNKRAGAFFLKHLAKATRDRVMLAPSVLSATEFMSVISGRETVQRIDALFRLYRLYKDLRDASAFANEEEVVSFDSFIGWGETVLEDFNEVEQYVVDADALFRNVQDLREITSNFLTEEQIKVIERYFGYTPSREDADRFWKSVGEAAPDGVKDRFVELWERLPQLYTGLLAELEEEGLALMGTTFRRAMEKVRDQGHGALPWHHVVVAGFNSLSTSESLLFTDLQELRSEEGETYAEFFWDATGPVLDPEQGRTESLMARQIGRLRKLFPEPEWARPIMERADAHKEIPSIEILASPSNAAQTKIAGEVVAGIASTLGPEPLRDARVAVVVPDENLLLPLLHSIPEKVGKVNLTMGYSLRYTSVASLMYHIRRLQTRSRKVGGQPGYYHSDLSLFLSHPLVHVVIGTGTANRLNGYIRERHRIALSVEEVEEFSPALAKMLRPVEPDAGVADVLRYVRDVLHQIDAALASAPMRKEPEDSNPENNNPENNIPEDNATEESADKDGSEINTRLERSQIAVYLQAVTQLEYAVRPYSLDMHFSSVFHLLDRLLSGEKITFKGEPLEGLQVMGLLETRALDFEHLVVLSMNDKVMPARARKRTFVPDSLRKAYGLPTYGQSEELYSYYFYRLLSRARNVSLIYDARAGEGMRSGGQSRFLLQLEMLYARDRVKRTDCYFSLSPAVQEVKPVEKNADVMRILDEFRQRKDGRNLSASALMHYCECPLKFYYEKVVGLSDESSDHRYVDNITYGNIVHRVMQNLYLPQELHGKYLKSPGVTISPEDLQGILDDPERINREVTRAANSEYFHLDNEELDRPLTGAVEMVADHIRKEVTDVVAHDLTLAPFVIIGVEIGGVEQWSPGGVPPVNIRYAFDRVDRVGDRYRIIDYKTGQSEIKATDVADIFSGSYKSKYLLQVLLYAHLLEKRILKEDHVASGDVEMVFYQTPLIGEHGETVPYIKNAPLRGHKALSGDFLGELDSKLEEIFDPSVPFAPTEDVGRCAKCFLRTLCNRQ